MFLERSAQPGSQRALQVHGTWGCPLGARPALRDSWATPAPRTCTHWPCPCGHTHLSAFPRKYPDPCGLPSSACHRPAGLITLPHLPSCSSRFCKVRCGCRDAPRTSSMGLRGLALGFLTQRDGDEGDEGEGPTASVHEGILDARVRGRFATKLPR